MSAKKLPEWASSTYSDEEDVCKSHWLGLNNEIHLGIREYYTDLRIVGIMRIGGNIPISVEPETFKSLEKAKVVMLQKARKYLQDAADIAGNILIETLVNKGE